MPETRYRAPVVHQFASDNEWKRTFTNWMREANKGGIANTGTVTLTANANATTILDERIGSGSFIGFMPTTAHAAVELLNLVIADQGVGYVTVSHTDNAFTDRSYVYCITG